MTDLDPDRDVTLARASVAAAGWLYLSLGLISVVQLGSGAVLARILKPTDFGLLASAGLLTRLIYYFAQFGVASALIQKSDLSERDFETGHAIAISSGAALSLLCLGLSPLLAALMPHTASAGITAAFGMTFLTAAPGVVPSALLRRQLRYKSIAAVESSTFFFGYVIVALPLAKAGAGAWSLVAAQLVQSALSAAGYRIAYGSRIRCRLHRTHVRHIATFGGKISLLGLLEFFGFQSDTFGVARSRGGVELGQYNRASAIVAPVLQLSATASRVLVSAFARAKEGGLKDSYLDVLAVIAVPTGWLAALLIVERHEVTAVLLGPHWPAVPALLIFMAVAVFTQSVSQVAGTLAEARAVLNPKVAIQVLQLAIISGGSALAVLRHWSLPAFAAAWALSEVVRMIAYLLLMERITEAGVLRQLAAALQALLPAAAFVVARSLTNALGLRNALLALALTCTLSALLTMLGVLSFSRLPLRATILRRLGPGGVRRLVRSHGVVR